ncbi:MAG: GNAT family N-acetyltransferase [Chloroflexi bacterium]|nr:GNAT family N-acetyltransferase [Chloroflexota bacterium]
MIRPIEHKDFDFWSQLWQEYLHFYRTELPDRITDATFERLTNQTDGLVGLIAEDHDSRLVGFAHLVFHPSTWSNEPYCYLEDLFVSREARGSSTANDLIRAASQEADRRGAARTYWHTQEYNGAARSLYDQLGRPTSFIVYWR